MFGVLRKLSPKGSPTPGSERMRLWRLRQMNKLPPVPTCKECGAKTYAGSGYGQAFEHGLCFNCYRKTPEYIKDRLTARRGWASTPIPEGVSPVGYWAAVPGGELERFQRLRAAVSHASDPVESGPVYVAWSDGRVTEHYDLTAVSSRGLTPDHPSAMDQPVDPEWFLLQLGENRFERMQTLGERKAAAEGRKRKNKMMMSVLVRVEAASVLLALGHSEAETINNLVERYKVKEVTARRYTRMAIERIQNHKDSLLQETSESTDA